MATNQSGPAPGQPATTSWLAVRLPRLGLTVCALLMSLLAVMPWVNTAHEKFYGSQVERTFSFGDGRVVALTGLAIVLTRIAMIWLPRWQTAVLALITALALFATVIAGRAAIYDWAGDVTAYLYLDVVVSIIAALCGALLLSARVRRAGGERPEMTETSAGG